MTNPNNMPFTPPKIESEKDPEFAERLHGIHQLVFERFQNHYDAIQTLTDRIAVLEKAQTK